MNTKQSALAVALIAVLVFASPLVAQQPSRPTSPPATQQQTGRVLGLRRTVRSRGGRFRSYAIDATIAVCLIVFFEPLKETCDISGERRLPWVILRVLRSTLHRRVLVIAFCLGTRPDSLGKDTQPVETIWSIKPAVAARLGMTLLFIPIYFISASALRQDAPGLTLLGSPMILLGALLVAFILNALSILSIGFHGDTPSVLSISLSLRFWNLTVIAIGLLLLSALLGYAFVENFHVRPGS